MHGEHLKCPYLSLSLITETHSKTTEKTKEKNKTAQTTEKMKKQQQNNTITPT
jgi:hypothetical protein